MARALIRVPARAKRGEVIEIRALVSHIMETGFRHDQYGVSIARDIIQNFRCTYNGVEIFRARFYQAIAANPFISFSTIATETGTIGFEWSGDGGFTATESAAIAVE
jgi:sulfur-oxidizing protein SoxZ